MCASCYLSLSLSLSLSFSLYHSLSLSHTFHTCTLSLVLYPLSFSLFLPFPFCIQTKHIVVIASFSSNQFCSILFVAYVAYSAAIHKTGIKAIIKGTDPLLERVLDLCPLIRAGPQPPFWLGNRHMQFIPWMGQNEFFRGSMNFETHDFTVTDCVVKGDSEKGGLDCVQDPSMDQVITIDVFPGFDVSTRTRRLLE